MVTNLEKLKEIAKGEEIQIPGWTEEPFCVRVKRTSLLGLAAQGKIPNGLLAVAQRIFTQKVDTNIDLKDIYEVMQIVAEDVLVEPTVNQLEELGLKLTDEQMTAIFNYSQQGSKALERFRTK